MVQAGKRFLTSIVIIIISAVAAAVILTACFLIPVNQANFETSIIKINEETGYPMMPYLSDGVYFETHFPGVLDNCSDKVMLLTALDNTPDKGNALQRAMRMYSEYMGEYSYYWHGYTAILRPLILLFDYMEIRVINGILQIIVLLQLAKLIGKKLGTKYELLLFTSFFLLMPMAMGVSLQYSWVFYIAAISTIILLRYQKQLEQKEWIGYAFLIIGVVTCFFDLLTYPLFTWGFPLIWWILLSEKEKNAWEKLKTVVFSGVQWILGYAGIWVMKWTLGNIILGRNVWSEAITEIFLRVGAEDQIGVSARLDAIMDNWSHYSYNLYLFVIAVWVVYYAISTITKGVKWDARYPAFALIGISPIVWYWVLAEHTLLHNIFTYRIFNIGILAIIMSMVVSIGEARNSLRQTLLAIAKWMVLGIVAIVIVVIWKGNPMELAKNDLVFYGLTVMLLLIYLFDMLKNGVLYIAKNVKKS